MSDGITIGPPPSLDAAEQARLTAERLFGKQGDFTPPPGSGAAGGSGQNPIDALRAQALGRPSPWGGTDVPQMPVPPPAPGSDRQPDRPRAPISNGVLQISYGDPNFDARLAQNDYNKVVITGVPKELSPSPWVDETGHGYFFWFKNPKSPDNSDRTKHYFPANLKQIEIAEYQGHIYKPVLINADDMRIAANQSYMKEQNQAGYGSFRSSTDAFTYAAQLAKASDQALQYQEQLMRQGAQNSPSNPYFHIYLADILTAEAVQPVIQAIMSGKTAYFDNPQTNAKIDEAIKESQMAGWVTRKYGNLMKPPAYEMPLSPFSLNPNAYNPDAYWSGAAYQSAIRESQLAFLKNAVIMGKLPIELPPALPPKQ